MARAVIVLSDDPTGYVEMTCTFDGEYDKNSHAHGQASLIIKSIDDLAADKVEISKEVL